jgi:hypothetical protein
LDSYKWSERFESQADVSRWKSIIANGILFTLVLDEIKPLYHKRIYYADNNLWNFNPTKTISIFRQNYRRGLENPKVIALRKTGCIEDFKLEMGRRFEAQKSTIKYFSPNIPHHMVTLKLGEKDGIPVYIVQSLSSKGDTPPYYTKTDTGILLPSEHKIHYSSNMIMPGDYLNEVDYKVNSMYPYQEIFRNELGRLGTIFSLLSDGTIYHIPNTKLIRYEPNIIKCGYEKYCIENNIEMNLRLNLSLKNTIHRPRIISL